MSPKTRAIALFAALIAVALYVLVALPPVSQSQDYHQFSDQRTIQGLPNFWNVVSNIGFLAVGLSGWPAIRRKEAVLYNWERVAYAVLLSGVILTAFGSSYYHLHPDDTRLVWDRLPMTAAFLALFSMTLGERIDERLARFLLFPLLIAGAASVMYWMASGDLRWYGLVQFVPLLALPAMLALFPPCYTQSRWVWAMLAFYALAKAAELWDRPIARIIATGGHPWKHLLAAAAVGCYVVSVGRRKPDCLRY